MTRLLREKDFKFLAAQPGFSPQLGRRFRAARRQVFRSYLRILRKDFRRAASACWILMIRAADDRQDLAKILIRQHLMFALAVFAVEGRLLLHAVGVGTGTVDVRGLLESLETVQSQMRLVLTPPQAATALG
jgi:ribosomal protein L20